MPKADKVGELDIGFGAENSSERKLMPREVRGRVEQRNSGKLERKNIRDGKITASAER